VIENLLGAPSPGMMFAHELAGRVHGALVIRVASILVEAVGSNPTPYVSKGGKNRIAADKIFSIPANCTRSVRRT
jgi:hypothetical protein